MRLIFTVFVYLLLATQLAAQIPNASFENWQAVPGALGAEDPVGWTSNNVICDTVQGYAIRKSSVARTGSYALEIRPSCNFNNFRYAAVFLGKVSIDTLAQNLFSMNPGCSGDSLINSPPFILAGFYQYRVANSSERNATGNFLLKNNNCRSAAGFIAPAAHFDHLRPTSFSGNVSSANYAPFAIPLRIQTDTLPALNFMEIAFVFEHQDTSGSDPRFLLIDDLSLHGNLLSVPQENLASMFQLYPNPVKDFVKLKKPEFMEVTAVRIYSASGRKMFAANAWRDRIDLTDFDEGLYIISFYTNAGLITKRLVKL